LMGRRLGSLGVGSKDIHACRVSSFTLSTSPTAGSRNIRSKQVRTPNRPAKGVSKVINSGLGGTSKAFSK
jgi:hypothetical protein